MTASFETAHRWARDHGGLTRGSTVTYPGYGPLRLFTRAELRAMLARAGLRPVCWWGIHSVTNLIPSTILHRESLGTLTAALYRRLRALDARLCATRLAARTANSLVVLAERIAEQPSDARLTAR